MTVDKEQLEITVSDELDRITFSVGDTRLGVITEPRLLWECSCHREDGGQSPEEGPCRLHSLPGFSRISALFGRHTCLSYRGVRIWWNGHNCWPPSIDSFFLAKTLTKQGWPYPRHRRLWDIGAGTGFLGLQLSNACTWIEDLYAVEPDPAACAECQCNFDASTAVAVASKQTIQCGLDDLEASRFQVGDAVVSNPPYLPRAPWQETDMEAASPTVGTEVLRGLVHLVEKTQIDVALCYSCLAEADLRIALSQSPNVKVTTLSEMEVPLRIHLDARYIEWLIAERGLETHKDDVFAYAQKIRVITLESGERN